MGNWLVSWFDSLAQMAGGPGHLRFVLQPLLALLLGIRDGRLDARAGTPPFLWRVVFEPESRRATWASALRTTWKPLVVATVLDAVLQLLTTRSLHVGYALLTGCLLVGLPYVIVRALSNRIASRVGAHPGREPAA